MNWMFTAVWKQNEEPLGRDDYLPSVMTCANHLKVPNYSSKEVLRTRLLTAMNRHLEPSCSAEKQADISLD
jgi:E3 ubiquitin-protein ligase TRIP12